jgi:transcription elongation factor GreA
VVTNNISISEAAKLFAGSLAPKQHLEGQEALRFARWFGEARSAADVRPPDLEAYVETFGVSSPNAPARADALKSFLSYAHTKKMMPERMVSHVRVRKQPGRPRVTSSASATAAAASTNEVQLTAEGRASLVAELEGLKEQRPRIAADLRAARADGDVSENAPLDAAREAQGQLEARIRELEGTLRQAVVLDADGGSQKDVAHIGCNVVISNLATGAELSYQLVNAAEARPGTGRLSAQSPVGQALIGHRVGDTVEVTAPSGVVRFKIAKIEA